MELPSPKPGLKVVRSREHIAMQERRGSELSFNNSRDQHQHVALVSCASAQSLQDVVPVLELPAPPDGGWGWVIVFASFMNNLIIDGIAYSFGVLLPVLVSHFDSNKSTVSWVGSLLCGLYMGSGPIVGGLVNKFGCRSVCIAGGTLSCLAMLLSTQSVNVAMLMVTYGIAGGFGMGLVYLPSVCVVGYYFEKKRALATGMAVCGSGVGCFVMAPIANFLLETFGWRGANVIFAGMCLNACVMGALMRPLELSIEEPQLPKQTVSHNPDTMVQLPDSQVCDQVVKRGSIVGGVGQQSAGTLGLPAISSVIACSHASMSLLQEEIAEEPEYGDTDFSDDDDRFEEDAGPPTMSAGNNFLSPPSMTPTPTPQKPLTNPGNVAGRRRSAIADPAGGGGGRKRYASTSSSFRRNHSEFGFGRLTKVTGLEGPPEVGREHIVYGVNDGAQITLQPSRRNSQAIVRPMSRKDIFYGGSVMQLAEEQETTAAMTLDTGIFQGLSSHSSGNTERPLDRYRHSVISFPRGVSRLSVPRGSIVANHLSIRKEAIDPELLDLQLNDDHAVLRVLREMVDVRLLANPRFLLICLSNILGFLALYIPYVYLPSMITAKGISMEKASFIVSAIGISNTVGRVVIGYLVDFPWVSSLIVTNVSLVCSGVCVLAFPACEDFAGFIIVALMLGLSVSAYISLTSIILVDLLGLDALTSAFGLLVSFRGVASIVGPPLAGFVYEATDDLNASFYMAGGFFIAAGIMSQVAYFIQRFAKKKK